VSRLVLGSSGCGGGLFGFGVLVLWLLLLGFWGLWGLGGFGL